MVTVGSIGLTEHTEIIFYTDTYKNRQFANIRKFIKSKKYTGPTKSGVKLNKQELETILAELKKIPLDIKQAQESDVCLLPIYDGKNLMEKVTFFTRPVPSNCTRFSKCPPLYGGQKVTLYLSNS